MLGDVYTGILPIILFINMLEIFHGPKFIKVILKIPHAYMFMFTNWSPSGLP